MNLSERNKYLLGFLLFIILVSISGYYIAYSPALSILVKPSVSISDQLPDTYVNQANITSYDQNGAPKYRMTSAQIIHYPGEKDAELFKPLIFVFQERGNPWKIQAQKGKVTSDGERVQLDNQVVISRQASDSNTFSQLESEQLFVWPKQEYAESDKAVKIKTADTLVTAVGLEADLYEQQYHLLTQVKVKHLKGISNE